MTQSDILALAHAGFTSTQILAIGQLTQPVVQTPMLQQPAPQPVVQTPMLQQPAPQPVVQTPVVQQPVVQTPVVQTDPVLEQLKILTGAVQSNALLTAQQTQQTQTADTVLASIINPPAKEDNK